MKKSLIILLLFILSLTTIELRGNIVKAKGEEIEKKHSAIHDSFLVLLDPYVEKVLTKK